MALEFILFCGNSPYTDLGEERLSTFYILNGSSSYPLLEATFKANGDTMIYVMPSHVSLVRQEALPHLVGETVCSVRRVPPPRKIL